MARGGRLPAGLRGRLALGIARRQAALWLRRRGPAELLLPPWSPPMGSVRATRARLPSPGPS
jgi:hypothetical protein